MDQVTTFNVKAVAHTDESIDMITQCHFALWTIFSICHCLFRSLSAHNFTFLVYSYCHELYVRGYIVLEIIVINNTVISKRFFAIDVIII